MPTSLRRENEQPCYYSMHIVLTGELPSLHETHLRHRVHKNTLRGTIDAARSMQEGLQGRDASHTVRLSIARVRGWL
jgi:hypothetical protein